MTTLPSAGGSGPGSLLPGTELGRLDMGRVELPLSRLPAVVAFGGGHGLSASLTALRRVTDRLTAVVTVADDGGSSGRLRDELDCLPPGDLRMALAALCTDDEAGRTWAEILQYRFTGPGWLHEHAVGNLLIAGIWERLGDPVRGLDLVARLLGAAGRVLPMSSVPLEIEAEVIGLDPMSPDEISVVRGQNRVAKTTAEVRNVRLLPIDPPACQESVDSVLDADWLVLGPGSWFTSIIPHLLVPELADAILRTTARRVLTLNVQTDAETQGFSAARHIELLAEHAPKLRLDAVLVDKRFAGNDAHLEAYARSLGAELVVEELAARDGSARHDPLRLASAYAGILGI